MGRSVAVTVIAAATLLGGAGAANAADDTGVLDDGGTHIADHLGSGPDPDKTPPADDDGVVWR